MTFTFQLNSSDQHSRYALLNIRLTTWCRSTVFFFSFAYIQPTLPRIYIFDQFSFSDFNCYKPAYIRIIWWCLLVVLRHLYQSYCLLLKITNNLIASILPPPIRSAYRDLWITTSVQYRAYMRRNYTLHYSSHWRHVVWNHWQFDFFFQKLVRADTKQNMLGPS